MLGREVPTRLGELGVGFRVAYKGVRRLKGTAPGAPQGVKPKVGKIGREGEMPSGPCP